MNNKVIIALAPPGGWGAGRNNPVIPEDIAEDVIACAAEGAAERGPASTSCHQPPC